MPATFAAYYTDRFVLPLPAGHRFPMAKYRRTRQRLGAGPVATHLTLAEPPAATEAQLRLVHAPAYLESVLQGTLSERQIARLGFPWSPQLVERSRRSVGATLAAARRALRDGVAFSLAGGTHHARHDSGHGYCVFNDAAVAARVLQHEGLVQRVTVLDLDVHQGNGTAQLLAGRAGMVTISVNEAPAAGRYAYASYLDIDVARGAGDQVYLQAVRQALAAVGPAGRPDLLLLIAGADPHEHDVLGQLAVTTAGLAARDRLVFAHCREHGLPVAVTMGGGYQEDIDTLAALHAGTVELGVAAFLGGC